ncbi:zf-HC2 domain-containing protein [Streptomyces sp. NPDC026672]|uniref:zf-HC2 domain-containing protein n=1 Tax=unclassified Streptomyces TaxID=2593676 RepID=UPI0033CC26B0
MSRNPDDTGSWHARGDLVARYADGTLPDPEAWSLEAHLERCGACAARVSAAVRATAAGPVLADVRRAVLAAAPAPDPLPHPYEHRPARPPWAARLGVLAARHGAGTAGVREPGRGAGGFGHPHAHRPARLPWTARTAAPGSRPLTVLADIREAGARGLGRVGGRRVARLLWAAGPAVRGGWFPALLLVAAGALALAHGGEVAAAHTLLLAVAPLVPVAGVALSYGPHADPLHEIAAATPSGGLRLALTRTAAVLVVSLPLLTLAGLLLPVSGAPGAAAWLLPGLALTLGSLALGSYVGCRTGTAVAGGCWLAAVLAPALAAPGGALGSRLAGQLARWVDGAPAQGAWAAAAVLCAAVVAVRRTAYDRPEPW